MNWVWMGIWGLIGIAFWGFLFWLAWALVAAVKGIREELRGIRAALCQQAPGGGPGS